MAFNVSFVEQKEMTASFEAQTDFKIDYEKGFRGESAYQLAVRKGFIGTEEEWLKSMEGSKVVINGIDCSTPKTFEDLGEETISNSEIKEIIDKMYKEVFG